jgi:hypothetical protein
MAKVETVLFGFFGSKARIAPKYPKPIHDTIIEPFAGAAGYACLYPHKQVILYEKDEIIAGVLDFLIKSEPEDIMNLPLIPPDKNVDDYDLCQEAKWAIGYWMASAKQNPNKRLSKWATEKREWPNLTMNFWGTDCRIRLAKTVAKIGHWKVYHESWENSERHNDTPATWFIDPPYIKEGKWYRKSNKFINYDDLGEWCQTRNGQTIVCESKGAEWLPFEDLCELKGIGKGRKRSTEVIWTRNS